MTEPAVHTTSRRRVIALAAGGTAGHVNPALDVAAAYLERHPTTHVIFIGVPGGVEERLVPLAGHRLEILPGAPIFGTNLLGKAKAAVDVYRGTLSARNLFAREGVQLVLGFGGYASAGALLAARSMGILTGIYEPNASPGLTNRVLSGFADRIYTSDASRDTFAHDKSLLVGVPVRAGIVRAGKRRGARQEHPDGVHILITGGSIGSPFVNERAPALMAALAARGFELSVWHQTGRHSVDPVRARYAQLGLHARVEPYIQRAATAYEWADFGVFCAGATTLAEVCAARLPALVTPLSTASESHQVANAETFATNTGLPWASEAMWEDNALAREIERFLRDDQAYAQACDRLLAAARDNTAARVVEDCERLVAAARVS